MRLGRGLFVLLMESIPISVALKGIFDHGRYLIAHRGIGLRTDLTTAWNSCTVQAVSLTAIVALVAR